ncbi:MAG: metallophosphoesterase [Methanobacteriaceae archaeon]|nr:metallophosphoesterase [Methanobacteriaceae archaeon]
MKIFVITDIHSKYETILNYLKKNESSNDFDKIIVTGDITNFGPENLVGDILDKLSDYGEVYAIPGNCDPKNITELIDNSRAINLHDNILVLDDLVLVGFGGSNKTPFDTPNEFDEEIIYEKLNRFKKDLIENKTTILVTHVPPVNTGTDKTETDLHVGSTSVRKIIEETQPTINICGHVHESIAVDKIQNTIIINPGDAATGHACILEIIDDNQIKYELIEIE